MSDTTRYELVARCMQIKNDKSRCIRDASHDFGGRYYCTLHYNKALERMFPDKLKTNERARK